MRFILDPSVCVCRWIIKKNVVVVMYIGLDSFLPRLGFSILLADSSRNVLDVVLPNEVLLFVVVIVIVVHNLLFRKVLLTIWNFGPEPSWRQSGKIHHPENKMRCLLRRRHIVGQTDFLIPALHRSVSL
jgi:hypothetical protein